MTTVNLAPEMKITIAPQIMVLYSRHNGEMRCMVINDQANILTGRLGAIEDVVKSRDRFAVPKTLVAMRLPSGVVAEQLEPFSYHRRSNFCASVPIVTVDSLS